MRSVLESMLQKSFSGDLMVSFSSSKSSIDARECIANTPLIIVSADKSLSWPHF